jgi:hypothetical protein
VPGQFFFSTYDRSSHDVIVFEEYEHDVYKSNYFQLKQLLDRKKFRIDIKNRDARSIRVVCPIIFISNFTPFYDRAFLRRINVRGSDVTGK